MFGYVRPLKGELKVREYERFKAVYCGLCHSLRRRCGFAARFVVNFDFTFLAMLLSEAENPCWTYRRCIASPFKKKCCHCSDPALDVAADYSVILAYWKLKDAVADEGCLKSLGSRLSLLLLRTAYRKAARNSPGFDELTRTKLSELSGLEREHCESIDIPADKFANILKGAARGAGTEEHRRILSQIFYHTGRIVYILDAVDDLSKDFETGSYNPLIRRYSLTEGKLSPEAGSAVRLTLRHSENLLSSAFELLPTGPWSDIISNIIYEGIPWVTEKVFSGEWHGARRIDKADKH